MIQAKTTDKVNQHNLTTTIKNYTLVFFLLLAHILFNELTQKSITKPDTIKSFEVALIPYTETITATVNPQQPNKTLIKLRHNKRLKKLLQTTFRY